MAKGQPLSNYQRKIVSRYYEHLDTITLGKLAEILPELFLASASGDARAADKLWARAAAALARTSAKDSAVARILETRDIKALGALVNDLSTGKVSASPQPRRPAQP